MSRRTLLLTLCLVLLAGGVIALVVSLGSGTQPAADTAPVTPPKTAEPAPAKPNVALAPATTEPRKGLAAPSAPGDGVFVTGSLTTTAGAAVPTRAVRFTIRAADAERAAHDAAPTQFDNDTTGAFRSSALAPGSYVVEVVGKDFAPVSFALELAPGAGEVRHDIVLEALRRYTVRLRTPTGAPLAHGIVNAPGFRPPFPVDVVATLAAWPLSTTAPARGNAVPRVNLDASAAPASDPAAGLEPASRLRLDLSRIAQGTDFIGVLECRADLRWANVLWREQVVANLSLPENGDELAIELDPRQLFDALSAVRLTCVDEQSRVAISGARVSVSNVSKARYVEVVTEADGSARLTGLSLGRTLVNVSADGYAPWRRLFELPPARVAELGEVALAPALEVSVRVVDVSGADVAHPLEFVELGPDGFEAMPKQVSTQATGDTRVRELAPRRYVVRSQLEALARTASAPGPDLVSAPGSARGELGDGTLAIAPGIVDLSKPPTDTLVFRLEPMRVCSVSLGFAEHANVRVCLTSRDRLRVAEADAAGDARVKFLLTPGEYVATVYAAGKELARHAWTFDGSVAELKLP